MDLIFGLKAKNSNGLSLLHFDKIEGDALGLCLTGEYKGQEIQIDFDALDKGEVMDLIRLLEITSNNSQGGN